jgi:hypothetical protein
MALLVRGLRRKPAVQRHVEAADEAGEAGRQDGVDRALGRALRPGRGATERGDRSLCDRVLGVGWHAQRSDGCLQGMVRGAVRLVGRAG